MSRGSMFHLICGLPGAGKTTLAKQLEHEIHAVRFCPDEWIEPLLIDKSDRTEMDRIRPTIGELQWKQIVRLLELGCNTVWEQGFWHQEERERFRNKAKRLGAKVILHYLDVPLAELKRRIQKRNTSLPLGSFFVEPSELDTWLGWFQAPSGRELNSYDEHYVYDGEGNVT